MIAFGVSITEPAPYHQYAEPGLRRAAEADSPVYAFAAVGSIGRSYNVILDAAAARDDLEALVLVHSHVEIADADFGAKVRRVTADPTVAVAGCVGATGVRTIAWWDGAMTRGPEVVHAYGERGGGEMPAYAWADADVLEPGGVREVEAVDGIFLALSPWSVRNLRFDEGFALGHGFDVDYCLQARAAGRRVVVGDFGIRHHHSLELVTDHELWVESHIQVAEKWDGRMPGVEGEDVDWKDRARHAEAEREAARAMAYSNTLVTDARVLDVERALERTTNTVSWRVTTPLRRLNASRRVRMRRRTADPAARH